MHLINTRPFTMCLAPEDQGWLPDSVLAARAPRLPRVPGSVLPRAGAG